jgi:hypothetical protein
MFYNTFEHGYSDAIKGNQRVLGSPDYRAGYDRGIRYMKSQKAIELAAAGLIAILVGALALSWVFGGVRLPV